VVATRSTGHARQRRRATVSQARTASGSTILCRSSAEHECGQPPCKTTAGQRDHDLSGDALHRVGDECEQAQAAGRECHEHRIGVAATVSRDAGLLARATLPSGRPASG
jgi:hypothetical protein